MRCTAREMGEPISPETWNRLVGAEAAAVRAGWATPGVFATAVGPDYVPGGPRSLLYVGKSGGPRIDVVGLACDQATSGAAATQWMLGRRNASPFWWFADLLTPDRACMAWSNLVKIDRVGAAPPTSSMWRQVREACLQALREELEVLRPRRSVFVTGGYLRKELLHLLAQAGYVEPRRVAPGEDLCLFIHADGRVAAITRHPQGWPTGPRNAVAALLRRWS